MRALAGLVTFVMVAAIVPAATADQPRIFIYHGVMVVAGRGTVSPGLPPTGPNSYHLNGTATVVYATGATNWSCTFTAGLLDGAAAGQGHGTAKCGPSPVLPCLVARAGLQLTFACLAPPGNPGELVATLALSPDNVLPTTSYSFTGVAEWIPLLLDP